MPTPKQPLLLVGIVLIGMTLWFVFPHASQANPTAVNALTPSSQETLMVGLYHNPPFAIKTDDSWDGIAVHLWRDIAEELELEYELQEVERDDVVSMLQDDILDVVITAVATAEQEEEIDFTHSYLASSLGMAEPQQRTLLELVGSVFSPRFIRISLWLSVLLAVIGVLVWLFERKANEDQFGGSRIRGIWAGFWWAGVTMSTIGYGDKAPKSVGGRVLALIWMLVAMGVTATLTATITSVVTLQPGLFSTTFSDLRSMKVGSVADSRTMAYLDSQRIQFQPYPAPLEGLQAVQNGDIEVFVFDAAVLRFVNSEELNGGLRIGATNREIQRHAFALTPDSDLRELLNQKLLEKTDSSAWQDLLERYLPDQSSTRR